MARGNTKQSMVIYKGNTEHFVVFVEDATAVNNWKKDSSIPLAQVVDGWKIFCSHHGPQGIKDEASSAVLQDEFGTSNEDEAIMAILEKGEIQESVVRNPTSMAVSISNCSYQVRILPSEHIQNPERVGVKNESQGPRGMH